MHNPIRRSRKIGLTQGGRVKAGRAYDKRSRVFTRGVWEQLSNESGGPGPLLLRENPSGEFYHPVSLNECLAVLRRLPEKERRPVKAIVLRRKPKIDSRQQVLARQRFRCVILNSFPRHNQIYWGRDPGEALRRDLSRWCSNWQERGGWTILQWSTAELRRFYLYDLLLHEVGHLHHPHLHQRSRCEAFADNYAREWAERLGEARGGAPESP